MAFVKTCVLSWNMQVFLWNMYFSWNIWKGPHARLRIFQMRYHRKEQSNTIGRRRTYFHIYIYILLPIYINIHINTKNTKIYIKYMLKYMEMRSAPSYGLALLLPMVSHWVDPESVVRPDSVISKNTDLGFRSNPYYSKNSCKWGFRTYLGRSALKS